VACAEAASHGVFRDYPVVTTRVDPARIADGATATSGEAGRFYGELGVGHRDGDLLSRRSPARSTCACRRRSSCRARADAAAHARAARDDHADAGARLRHALRRHGCDARLAFTQTGWLYPFFATLLGWLGVALTGSDTSSNVLFGSLQKITAQQLGFNPDPDRTANSTGGVMGKMIDAQSIVVATASTGPVRQEGRILRFVFWHSVALRAIMGVIVMLQAYVFPWMIPGEDGSPVRARGSAVVPAVVRD
jgi:hypothetical protein